MNNKVCVVISVHSAAPSYYELISFQQCFKILKKHAIYVIAPYGLDLSAYQSAVPEFKTKFVDKKWQASKLNYNKFKLSQYFYTLFENYEYLLTYELDAFIFSDDLDYWCDKGYDYIGAPWFEEYDVVKGNILRVGNSGFSLRKVNSIQQAIRKIYYVDPIKYASIRNYRFLKKSKNFIFSNLNIIASIKSLFSKENSSIQNASILYEDRVIANVMSRLKNFKIAPVEEAIKFSFEVNPEILYKMNDNTLPTGCHAWWLINPEFWQPFIENYGYKL
jgi:hypothetical protein